MSENVLRVIEGVEVVSQTSLENIINALHQEETQLEESVYRWTLRLLDESATAEEFNNLIKAVEVLKSSSGSEELVSLLVSLEDYKRRNSEIHEIEESLLEKEFHVKFEEQSAIFEHHQSNGVYSEAAWCLVGMQKMLGDYQTSNTTQTTDHQELVQILESCNQSLQRILVKSLEGCLQLGEERNHVLIKAQSEGSMTTLREAWKASEVLNMVDLILEKLLKNQKEVLEDHILAEDFNGTVLTLDRPVEVGHELLTWSTRRSSNLLENVKSRFSAVEQILQLLATNVLFEMHALVLELGNKSWKSLSEVLAAKALSAAEELRENERLYYLQGIFHASVELETQLRSIGFLSDVMPVEDDSFSLIISHSSKFAFIQLSEKFIKQARGVIIHPDWETLPTGKEPVYDPKWIKQMISNQSIDQLHTGVDYLKSSFDQGSFQISETVNQLVQIIQSAVEEGCKKGNLVLQCLIQTVKDICFLYQSMFPLLHHKEMEVPQLGMLTANDCFYMSQQLLKIPLTLPSFKTMAPEIYFLKEAQQLHAAGKAVISNMVASEEEELLKVLSQANNFGYLKTGQQGIAIRKASSQINRMLKRLGREMSAMLTKTYHYQMASSLTKAVVKPMLSTLIARTDISAQESKELPREVNSLLDELTPALLNIPSIDLELMQTDPERFLTHDGSFSPTQIDKWILYMKFQKDCVELRKLQRLMKIWDASLKMIVEWWRSGILEEEGFVSEDIRSLIWALFEHSDKREAAVAAVTS